MAISRYPYKTGETAGTEVTEDHSKDVIVEETDLTHPTHTDGLVDAGDPCYTNDMAGVARTSATATSSRITMARGGVWNLSVSADTGTVAYGTKLYLKSDGTLTDTVGSNIPFGYALGDVANGNSGVIAVLLEQF